MQVTETLNSGLKREIKVTIPASDLEAKLQERLLDASVKARINGFRPGKVPVQHLRKMFGKSFMAEIVDEFLKNSMSEILSERGEKAAMQPEIKMTEEEKEIEKVLSGKADFEYEMAYEVVPAIEIKDYTGIEVTRQVYDVTEEEIDDQIKRIGESARHYTTKDAVADKGDRLTIDFIGKLDGVPFDGGTGTDQYLVLGSGQFIPGFENQLIGVKTGDEKTITVTFPQDYQAANLAGKEATFDVTVKEVASADELELNDELAKSLGLDSMERLREIVKSQVESQFGALTRQKVKRELLDQLDESYKFEAPSRLIEAEFNNIWAQVLDDMARAGHSFADEETTEEEAQAEYRVLAERRVRLGLVLSEIGTKAEVKVSDEEMQRVLMETVRRSPANRQQEIFDFYRNNPSAMLNLHAPLYEEKVVDHLLTQISVTDRKVSKEELLADDENIPAEKKPAKKAKAEKSDEPAAAEAPKKKAAAPKKKAAEKDAE